MEFQNKLTDYEKNTITYFIGTENFADGDEIKFLSYKDSTMDKTGSHAAFNTKENALLGGYFLRKGFIDAVMSADESVLSPMYITTNGKPAYPKSKDEAVSLIYQNKLSIEGFRYNPKTTHQQKLNAFKKIVTHFIAASKNPDFENNYLNKHQFAIFNADTLSRVVYNTKNPENYIYEDEIKERLGIESSTPFKMPQNNLDIKR